MRLQAALEGNLNEHMKAEARTIETAVGRAVNEATTQAKAQARAHVASRLGRRAGFLITSKVYKNGPVDQAGLVYSRWKRAASGSKLSGSGPTDVLAAHAYGATITARNSRFLYIPLTKGRLRRFERRIFQQGVGSKDVALIPFTDKRGNLGYVIREKTRRGKAGRAIALLIERVEIGRSLNLEPIYRAAERTLESRLLTYLDRPAA